MGRDGKPIEGLWEAMCRRWEPHGQAICHDEEAPFPVPPLGPSVSSRIPFKPHCALPQCLGQLTYPDTYRALSHLPSLCCKPRQFTSSHGEQVKQRWIFFVEGKQMDFELRWNVIYDFPEVQQICR